MKIENQQCYGNGEDPIREGLQSADLGKSDSKQTGSSGLIRLLSGRRQTHGFRPERMSSIAVMQPLVALT